MHRRPQGFTLTEAIIVIVITGIISAVVAVFLVKPVQGYFDATRRAQLSDLADTALRRITRDLRLALPNSVRITSAGGSVYLEFLLTRGGGRYRAEPDSGAGGDVLELGAVSAPYRFVQVVEGAVSYVCAPNAVNPAAGVLRRYWGYAVSAVQPTAFGAGGNALLASDVAACAFSYSPNALAERNGVVELTLTLTQLTPGGPESVTLFQEAHVSNAP